jgi:DNA-binding XRE family transcriptional regulator
VNEKAQDLDLATAGQRKMSGFFILYACTCYVMYYYASDALFGRAEQSSGEQPLWIKQYDFVILIKELRVQLDLSQEDFAREIGVSYATVNRWENGRFLPSKMALRMVELYCDRMIELGRLLLPDDL